MFDLSNDRALDVSHEFFEDCGITRFLDVVCVPKKPAALPDAV
jgi:hypothetical protein